MKKAFVDFYNVFNSETKEKWYNPIKNDKDKNVYSNGNK